MEGEGTPGAKKNGRRLRLGQTNGSGKKKKNDFCDVRRFERKRRVCYFSQDYLPHARGTNSEKRALRETNRVLVVWRKGKVRREVGAGIAKKKAPHCRLGKLMPGACAGCSKCARRCAMKRVGERKAWFVAQARREELCSKGEPYSQGRDLEEQE